VSPTGHIEAVTFDANHKPVEALREDEASARALTDALVDELLAADTIVLAMGLYNFGVPSTVKSWFDRIVVPGRTLYEDGSGGPLSGRTLTLILAAGGGYGEGAPRHGWDHREPWIRHAFQQLGLTEVTVISAELTLARTSPALIPLDLGAAEDASYAAAERLIDAQFAPVEA
jgi:FMN-dependent NADH-azoreductase